jgi:hypothetical protein
MDVFHWLGEFKQGMDDLEVRVQGLVYWLGDFKGRTI